MSLPKIPYDSKKDLPAFEGWLRKSIGPLLDGAAYEIQRCCLENAQNAFMMGYKPENLEWVQHPYHDTPNVIALKTTEHLIDVGDGLPHAGRAKTARSPKAPRK